MSRFIGGQSMEDGGRKMPRPLLRRLFYLAAVCSLSSVACLTACSMPTGVAAFTAADAANAAAMAKSAGSFDPNAAVRIPCWQAWGTLAGALAQGGKTAGLLSATEAALEANAAFTAPACQAVAGEALLHLVR
jgi:hypothetical protein